MSEVKTLLRGTNNNLGYNYIFPMSKSIFTAFQNRIIQDTAIENWLILRSWRREIITHVHIKQLYHNSRIVVYTEWLCFYHEHVKVIYHRYENVECVYIHFWFFANFNDIWYLCKIKIVLVTYSKYAFIDIKDTDNL